ncbi:unnamed protein product, partial [Closterium sp. NIES-53]
PLNVDRRAPPRAPPALALVAAGRCRAARGRQDSRRATSASGCVSIGDACDGCGGEGGGGRGERTGKSVLVAEESGGGGEGQDGSATRADRVRGGEACGGDERTVHIAIVHTECDSCAERFSM